MLAALAFGAIGLGACGGGDSGGGSDATDATGGPADVTIKTFQFSIPASVPAGTITVANQDNTTHTFTEGEPGNPEPRFDLELEGPDAEDQTEVQAGTYKVHCRIHNSMTGTLVVA